MKEKKSENPSAMRTDIIQQDGSFFSRRVEVGLTIANIIYFNSLTEHKKPSQVYIVMFCMRRMKAIEMKCERYKDYG